MSAQWYRVEMVSGEETYCYFGSNPLASDELLQHIQDGKPFQLQDIFYYDEQEMPRSWRDWDPNYLGNVFVNPRFVVSVMPMMNDPRKRGGGKGSHPVLNFPGSD